MHFVLRLQGRNKTHSKPDPDEAQRLSLRLGNIGLGVIWLVISLIGFWATPFGHL